MDWGKSGYCLVILGIVIDFFVCGVLHPVVFRREFRFLPVRDFLTAIVLRLYGRLLCVLRLWWGLVLNRSVRRLLRWPHRRLLRLSGHGSRYLRLWRIGRLLYGNCHRLWLRLLSLLCRCRHRLRSWLRLGLRHRFIHQFEQAALVHRLFLLLHHFVNLLLVLWLGMEACLRECGDGILMVLGRDQLLRFLEVFLVFLPPLLLLFVSLAFASFAALLSDAAFSACTSN